VVEFEFAFELVFPFPFVRLSGWDIVTSSPSASTSLSLQETSDSPTPAREPSPGALSSSSTLGAGDDGATLTNSFLLAAETGDDPKPKPSEYASESESTIGRPYLKCHSSALIRFSVDRKSGPLRVMIARLRDRRRLVLVFVPLEPLGLCVPLGSREKSSGGGDGELNDEREESEENEAGEEESEESGEDKSADGGLDGFDGADDGTLDGTVDDSRDDTRDEDGGC
jgi:hypothetical protein